MEYSSLKIGMSHSFKRIITSQDVLKFAEVSGDRNPIHLDEAFAAKGIFKKPIVHGMLVGALFSKSIASDLPGPGSIYLYQDFNFEKPIFHNSELEIIVTVKELKPEKKIVFLDTICKVEEVVVVRGSTVVKCLV